jgi:lipopolysaccharide/colanic/teichoic acid biosynthesis glycosyltransferase
VQTEFQAVPLPVLEAGNGTGTISQGRWGSVSDRNVRRLNVVVAAVGIVVLLPLMVLIALAVWLTSSGPILYSQKRVGHDRRRGRRRENPNGQGDPELSRREQNAGGQIFTMYKFRTMNARVGGDASREVWASPADGRITPLGSVLRAYRLDELPQLFNVLRGEMNVVGPRPEQPAIFQELRGQVERYPERQVVLPGITGWAQVNHSYDQSIDDVRRKVDFDLEYIRRRSPAEDLRIMVRTLPVMVGRKGAL